MRRSCLDREIDKVDQRQRLDRGEIDADLVWRQIIADKQDVGIGQQVIEALDQKDGCGNRQPLVCLVGALAFRNRLAQAFPEGKTLDKRGDIGRNNG